MKVLWASGLIPTKLGSFEFACARISRELTSRGHGAQFAFVAPTSPAVSELLHASGAEILPPITDVSTLSGCLRTSSMAKARGIDIVHLHFHDIFTPLAIVNMTRGIKTVATYHISAKKSQARGLKRRAKRARHGLLAKGLSRVYCVSDFARETFVSNYVINPGLTETLYNGIELDRFSALPQDAADTRNPELVCVAALIPEKGVATLMHAFRTIRRRVPQARLSIVGDGPQREQLEQLASVLKIESHVRFLGQRNDVPDVLARATAAIIPSEWPEAFGLTVVEAMAAGAPTVASRIGGIPEIIKDGDTGLLFEPGNAEELAGALARLIGDPELRTRLSRTARRRAADFDGERQARYLVDQYTGLVEN